MSNYVLNAVCGVQDLQYGNPGTRFQTEVAPPLWPRVLVKEAGGSRLASAWRYPEQGRPSIHSGEERRPTTWRAGEAVRTSVIAWAAASVATLVAVASSNNSRTIPTLYMGHLRHYTVDPIRYTQTYKSLKKLLYLLPVFDVLLLLYFKMLHFQRVLPPVSILIFTPLLLTIKHYPHILRSYWELRYLCPKTILIFNENRRCY